MLVRDRTNKSCGALVSLRARFWFAAIMAASVVVVQPVGVRAAPPPSLKTVPVPIPSNLDRFVVDRAAAERLGKALFWDMQAGSDGIQACATCHFAAGADPRLTNQLSPGLLAGDVTFQVGPPNYALTAADFPFHQLADPLDPASAVLFDANDVASSMGVFASVFNAVVPGSDVDDCTAVFDPVFNVGGAVVRRVEPRNTPSVINAVFNFRNFWDGRASFFFNGVDPVGPRNPDARVLEVQPDGSVASVAVLIDHASLASQAVGPPLSPFEMSCDGRSFPDLGKKLLSLTPLAKQVVSPTDSLLGPLANSLVTPGMPGLSVSYAELIRQAFDPAWWDSDKIVTFDAAGNHVLSDPTGAPLGPTEYTVMEANFSLFWGLAIQLYETLLISDDSPFDRFMDGGGAGGPTESELTPLQQEGLNIFLGKGGCDACHVGAEMSAATINNIGVLEVPDAPGEPAGVENLIETMPMADGGIASYDTGFYNIGVRPTFEDLGVGGEAAGPICFARRAEQGLPIPEQDFTPITVTVPPGARVACDGAFKTPVLRNLTLTRPFFHNGGMFTLEQVVEFYNRGGDFALANIDNLAPDIDMLGLDELDRVELVAFLEALTDERVTFREQPFDHPELFVPVGQDIALAMGVGRLVVNRAIDVFERVPQTGAEGHCVGLDSSPRSNALEVTTSCDDFSACTEDVCDPASGCVHTAIVCDDGNACTADRCDVATGCVFEPVVCDDGNPCTADRCDAAVGCVHTPNSAPCDDGDACTTADTCSGGVCVGGPALVCDDGNPCTADSCDAASGCTAATNGACTGLVCIAAGTHEPSVFSGAMKTGTAFTDGTDADPTLDNLTSPLVFADSTTNAFNGGSGDEVVYDVFLPASGPWTAWARLYYPGQPGSNDANSFLLSIDGGVLRKLGNNKDFFRTWHWDGDGAVEQGAPVGLDLGALGAGTHTVVVEKREVLPVGSQPRLDVLCFATDGAAPPSDAAALAAAGARRCTSDAQCDDGNACTDDVCRADGSCSNIPNFAPCDDGVFCNGADRCEGGACVVHAGDPCAGGGECASSCDEAAATCNAPAGAGCADDGDVCTDDVCDGAGACVHPTNSAPCDDGVACTVGDTCSAGVCAGVDGCAAGTECDLATGVCVSKGCTIDADCDDGNVCNGTEVCSAGVCAAGTALVCNDGDLCTNDLCDPVVGCRFAAVNCDDGDACTTDSCDPALGCTTEPVVCDDGDACTTDICDPALGCTAEPVVCDDGDPCTTDSCNAIGGCRSEPIVCDDGIACTADTCVGGVCVATDVCPSGTTCNSTTGLCAQPPKRVCIAAATDPTAVFSGAMTAGAQFTAGADLDPALDNLTTPLLFADSTSNALAGGSGDQVAYRIVVPATGSWWLWGRFYYPGQPGSNEANSFFASVDGGALKKLGNDKDKFRTWHWDGNGDVEGGAVSGLALGTLTAGEHTLVVEKREVLPTGSEPRLDVLCLTQKSGTPPADADALVAVANRRCLDESHCAAGQVCNAAGVCESPPTCATAGDCDDADPCTVDACNAGQCMHAPKSCADGDLCTVDRCDAATGACLHEPADCDDGNLCTVDSCDGATGACVNEAVACPAGESCNPATGACQSVPDLVCAAAGGDFDSLLGAMTTGAAFTAGADDDPTLDNLTSPLLFSSSTTTSFTGGSGDEAHFTLNVPVTDVWWLWGRFYYPGLPGSNDPNSFLIRLDAGAPMKFGNNKDFFRRWHWDGDGAVETGPVSGLALGTVTAGSHVLVVEKREAAAGKQPRLDVLCLTRSASVPPSDAAVLQALQP